MIYPAKATIPQILLLWAINGSFALAGILIANGIVELMAERLLFALPQGGRYGGSLLNIGTYGPIVLVIGFHLFAIWSLGPRHAGISNLKGLKWPLSGGSVLLGLYSLNWLILYLFDDLKSIAYAHCVAAFIMALPWLYFGTDQFGGRKELRSSAFWIALGIASGGLAAYAATAQGWLTVTHWTGLKFGLGIDLIHLSPIIDPFLGMFLAVVISVVVSTVRGR